MHRKMHKHTYAVWRNNNKVLNMKLFWLLIWTGAVFSNQATTVCITTSQTVTCTESARNYSSIPSNISQNVTHLNLMNNRITLNNQTQKALQIYSNLTELYLNDNVITVLFNNVFCNLLNLRILDISHNNISTILPGAFIGLNQLSKLNLQHNKILELDSDVFTPLRSLTVLNLHDNLLKYFDIKASFKMTTIALAGNPWNCSCRMLILQKWLNVSNVTVENENETLCAYPEAWKKSSIKTAPIQTAGCQLTATTTLSTSSTNPKSMVILTSSLNSTSKVTNNATHSDSPPLGKSWAFLVGVLIFVLTTTVLIFTAVKCPTWYRYLISYNHRRLEEDEPDMFEEEFAADISHFPPISNDYNQEDSTVIFKQIHTFVPEEDGFIEDKYIDTNELVEEN
ncbi:leucine-rich repeat-containing protein 19 [Alligator sinensis]|uniref:Leucine-rich repeat-containing protein 19 n=1 Tax=Alligator sinensis TaxID=38654 RepID=A0A3Q0GX45_ALLSI|nr:leucine-rich repeat-containing protein 19 [Alligator sinensis]